MTTERTIEVGGIPTRVAEAGAGRTVLWLHDTLGNCWTRGHDRLSEQYHIVAPSLPGFDDSSCLEGIDAPEDVVFWLLDLIEALSLDPPVLLGCGLGGWMGAELAIRHPDRLAGLILVDAYGLHVEDALPADEFALTPPMLRPLLFREGDGALAQEWLPDVQSAERLAGALHARVAAARLAWQFPYSPKLRRRLARARVPALVLWGGHDRLVPVEHANAYAAGLPDARVVVMPDSAHYPYAEEPDRFSREIAAFIG